jgi:uncharacterized membrane protein
MDELHPAIVHFPIAAVAFYPWLELARNLARQRSLGIAAMAMLGVGVVASMIASATGEAAYDVAIDRGFSHEVLESHEEYAEALPWALIVVLALRLYLERRYGAAPLAGWVGFGLGLALTGYVLWVGHTGGLLVYDHGVGVRVPGIVP